MALGPLKKPRRGQLKAAEQQCSQQLRKEVFTGEGPTEFTTNKMAPNY